MERNFRELVFDRENFCLAKISRYMVIKRSLNGCVGGRMRVEWLFNYTPDFQ